MTDSFPRRYARTQRFTLGEPRTATVSPDGRRVVFARSRGGEDPVNCLWVLDPATGDERLVADPSELLGDGDADDLPVAERARRERAREGAGGVVSYATDRDVLVAAFALAGRLFVAGLVSAAARELPVDGPVFDPRPDPTARRVAYVSGRSLRVAELDGTVRTLKADDDENVSWGSAEFVAAEEMGRGRGYWWSPDGESLAVARVDTTPVIRWWIADPAQPEREPVAMAYPAAGTANAAVTLHIVGLDGESVEVDWDHDAFPYLAAVTWTGAAPLLLVVSRDQHDAQVLSADPSTGTSSVVFTDHDDAWIDLVGGTPGRLDDDRLVVVAARDGARRLLVDGEAVTPDGMDVRAVVSVAGSRVVFTATRHDESSETHVWTWTAADGCARLTEEPGVHSADAGGDTIVVRSATLAVDGSVTRVHGGPVIGSSAIMPLERPNVTLMRSGEFRAAGALVLPRDHDGTTPLPVLLDPYGGPSGQRVVSARSAYLSSQWFADQGFAVLIVDGRGTPGRGSAWERAVHLDLAGPILEDQVSALHDLAARHPYLDLGKVAIRGWSFGGYLAALAVLRRPDVFHAAVAGAPVTDWRRYDTYYTERFLGLPSAEGGAYDDSSLLKDAPELTRPLLLIHGLADDNVVAAHTLQLSAALLAAGRSHQVLPLSGVTHMTPQEVVAENLLLLQLAFLRQALAIA